MVSTIAGTTRSGLPAPPRAAATLEPSALEDDLLSPVQLGEMAQVFLRLEEHFGGPQDIEWTIDGDGRLHLLQSRPITTAASAQGEVAVFSNANINENYPDPVSPLLQSLARTSYYHYFRSVAVAFGVNP